MPMKTKQVLIILKIQKMLFTRTLLVTVEYFKAQQRSFFTNDYFIAKKYSLLLFVNNKDEITLSLMMLISL